MAGIKAGFPDGVAKTPFLVEIDKDACTLCGKCIKACNTACVSPVKEARIAMVDDNVCLGCGACIDVCPEGAMHLVERDKRPKPPLNKGLMFARILKEKKRLMPVVTAELKRGVKRLVKS
jgi:MinD superfamily P-loop ATPase